MNQFDDGFTLQLFHVSDQEANTNAVSVAPQFSAILNALRAEDIDGDGVDGFADTLTLSSGDVWIPGLFYDASESVFGAPGAADILIQNALGIQAAAFGNHEFDNGTEIIAQLLAGLPPEDGLEPFGGADFPYLSGNLDFGADSNLAPLVTGDGQAADEIGGRIAASTVVSTASGERIGVVGATTPTLATISSPGGDIVVSPAPFDSNDPDDIGALADVIQADVDALLAAEPGLDKVILLSHMQQIAIETQLAERLTDVDIIVAGGSNTRLVDDNDEGFGGEPGQGVYPIFREGEDGNPVAIVNTDFQYKYVGRLVIDFDDKGVIVPESYDPELSGAFATDDAGVERLGAAGLEDPEIVAIADRVDDAIIAGESEFFAVSEVFLNGERQGGGLDGVRTQETNLGNLTADANLAYAQSFDPDVVVSIKNGGGIRASVGQIFVPGGGDEPVRLPPEGVDGAKPEGGISVNDVANTLAFNNGLSLVSLTTEQLADVLEHIVSEYVSLEVDSGMGQLGGVKFSFDPSRQPDDRIVSAGVFDEEDDLVARIVEDGEVVDNGDRTFRTVTLDFLADGGSDYPFPEFETTSDRVELLAAEDAPRTGGATFAADGTEQDALAEYLLTEFGREPGDPTFDMADTPPELDERIQNLDFRADTVLGDAATPDPVGSFRVASFNASLNRGSDGELAADLATPDDAQAQAVAEIIQRNAPDVLLVNEFDFDAEGEAARLFQNNYLSVSQNGAEPIEYAYRYVFSSNTGVLSGFDLDNNGVVATAADLNSTDYANDSFGFGLFEGQFAFAVYSRYEIDTDAVRSFQNFLWQDMPEALLFETTDGRPLFDPERPFDPENPDDPNTSFYTAEEAAALRLSSKNHVDLPMLVGDDTVHLLAAHPTPPVFDGIEDRNGKRNFDEIRFWKDYVAGADYIYDDAGNAGGLEAGSPFVIVGDYNADPFDGDSRPGAARQLLDNPFINGSTTDPDVTPSSDGGVDATDRQGGVNRDHAGDPAFDTADFNDGGAGNLRVDYALPSEQGLAYLDGGVFWPTSDDPLFDLAGDFPFPSSDHRLVYVDLALADDRRGAAPIDGTDADLGGDSLGVVEIASGTVFEDTVVGGLSGLTYDPASGRFLAVSDDRDGGDDGTPRLYELNIDLSDGRLDAGDVEILDVMSLTLPSGATLDAISPDPEGIAIGPAGELYISSERDFLGNPAVYQFDRSGVLQGALPVDAKFQPNPQGSQGVVDNLGFESLTITPDKQTLYTATESALVQDGDPATVETGAAARIVRYDLATGMPTAEFVYEVDPIANAPVPDDAFADSGLVDLLAIDNQGTLLALERSFSTGALDRGFTGKLYLVETQGATDVRGVDALPTTVEGGDLDVNVDEVVRKELLLDLGDLGIPIDNIEGLTLGPVLEDDRQSLIITSDDNFGAFGPQATQFITLAVDIDRVPTIAPVVETPEELRFDNALDATEGPDPDDPAIWLHPEDADQSVVVTSMKNDGLRVYDLAGNEVQSLQPDDVRYNNVDVMYDVDLGDRTADLVVASDRANDSLAVFEVDRETGELSDVTAAALEDPTFSIFGTDDGDATAYGLAAYRSRIDGTPYVFVTQADGAEIAQLELGGDDAGNVTAEVVRTIPLPVARGDDPVDYQSEGIAVDRETGIVYVTVEDVLGVIAFGAEPSDPATAEVIIDIDEPFFTPDLEGISILYGEDGAGALVVSSQGDATFAVFDRQTYDYIGSFALAGEGEIDGVEDSDGLDIFAGPLGSAFPNGLLVTQDGSNEPAAVFPDPEDGEVQNYSANFKYTDLEAVLSRLDVAMPDQGFDPRAVVTAGTDGNDTLAGGAGASILIGEAGNDRLIGTAEDDVLKGGAGRDTLQGNDGDDRLVGGAERDVLIGGHGADLFVLASDTADIIRDFESADGDLVELAIAGIVDVRLVDHGRHALLEIDTGSGFATIANLLGGAGLELDAVIEPLIV